jgi:hypothetical protein
MTIIWEMCLQALEYFTLVVGVLGVLLSLMLLFAPRLTQSLSAVMNRSISFDRMILQFIDRDINTQNIIYRHNIISGVCLIVGSAFVLVSLLYRLDIRSFVIVFFGSGEFATTNEMLVSALAMVGKVTGVAGLLFGSILLFNPDQMLQIEKTLNTWFATQEMVDKMDQTSRDIDTVVYQRPVTFGLIGLLTSAILIFLAFHNLMR